MAYQGDDRWRDRSGRSAERGGDRDWGRGDYGRNDYRSDHERGAYRGEGGSYRDDEDRGFFDRAQDELRSWFGDDEAQRRREEDNRRWEREQRLTGNRTNLDRYGAQGERPGGGWGNQQGASWHRDRPGEPGWLGGSERSEGDRASSGRTSWTRSDPRNGGPDTGDLYGYGRAPGGSAGFGGAPAGGGFDRSDAPLRRGEGMHDPHYAEWRQRQIDDLDRDYHEYRQENQSRFEQEFGTWRSRRQGQRQSLNRVTEHMEVVGSDGAHVGTVDKVRGDRIILARKDPAAGGMHHSVPCSWVESVDDKVTLNKSAEEARDNWRNEDRSRALFEREDSGSDGPHALNRSFAGTYKDSDEGDERAARTAAGRPDERNQDG